MPRIRYRIAGLAFEFRLLVQSSRRCCETEIRLCSVALGFFTKMVMAQPVDAGALSRICFRLRRPCRPSFSHVFADVSAQVEDIQGLLNSSAKHFRIPSIRKRVRAIARPGHKPKHAAGADAVARPADGADIAVV